MFRRSSFALTAALAGLLTSSVTSGALPAAAAVPGSAASSVARMGVTPTDGSGSSSAGAAAEVFGREGQTATATGPRVAFAGGDVVPVAPAVEVSSLRRLRSWVTVPVAGRAGVPVGASSAAVLLIRAVAASAAGQVRVRPLGASATQVVQYERTKSATGTVVVALGRGGALQVSASAGSPKVTVQVVGWIPSAASFVVAEGAVPAVAAAASSRARTLTLTGRAGVPRSVPALWVAVTVAARRAGTLALWRTGTAAPRGGVTVPRGVSTFLDVVQPDTAGRISSRMPKGAGRVSLTVVGWSLPGSTVAARATAAAASTLVSGRVVTLATAGRGGAPASGLTTVTLRVSGPKGARLDVWRTGAPSARPAQTLTLTGRPVTVLAAASDRGSVQAKLTKAPGRSTAASRRASVSLTGWSADPAGQSVSYTPRSSTTVVSPAQVVSFVTTTNAASVVLSATATRPSPGGVLILRPPNGVGVAMARIAAVASLSGGRVGVTLSSAPVSLADAYAEFKARYHGPVSNGPVQTVPAVAGALRANPKATAPDIAAASPAVSKVPTDGLSCSVGFTPSDVVTMSTTYDGDANFDLDLGARTLDFSLRGGVTVTVTLRTAATVSCTLEPKFRLRIPLGTTPLALYLGATATLTLAPEVAGHDAGATISATERVSSMFYVHDGTVDRGNSAGFTGSVTPQGERLTGTLEAGLVATVEPAIVFEGYLSASAGLTIGLVIKVGPPSGPISQNYWGPRCIVATIGLFLDVGADIAIPYFPDVSVDLVRWDSGTKDLWRGKCYGYTGTITNRITGVYEYGGTGFCHPDYCRKDTYDSTITQTMLGVPAQFPPTGKLKQPFAWSGHMHHTDVHDETDGVQVRRVVQEYDATGSGAMTWESYNLGDYFILDFGPTGAGPRSAYVLPNFADSNVMGTRTRSGWDPGGNLNGTFAEPSSITWGGILHALPATGPPLRDLPSFTITASDVWIADQGVTRTVTVALTRGEFAIPQE